MEPYRIRPAMERFGGDLDIVNFLGTHASRTSNVQQKKRVQPNGYSNTCGGLGRVKSFPSSRNFTVDVAYGERAEYRVRFDNLTRRKYPIALIY
jgi:hypothetical protein